MEFSKVVLGEFSQGTGIQNLDNGMAVKNRTSKSKVQSEERWRNGIAEKVQGVLISGGTHFQAIIAPSADVTNERTNFAWRARLEVKSHHYKYKGARVDGGSIQAWECHRTLSVMEKMGERLSTTIKGKLVVGMQEVALDSMMHTRSMKMAMEELFQSRQQEEPVEVESDDFESKSYQGSGETAVAVFDPKEEETRKVTDSQMKGEFGNPIGAKSYYMVRNAGGIRAANLFWYLEKVTPAALGLKTPAANPLMEEGVVSGSKQQKLLLGSPTIDVKSPFKVSWKDSEEPDSKVIFFSMGSEFKKSESKGKKITLFLTGIVGSAKKNVLKSLLAKEGSSASHGAMGNFSPEEATNCLTDSSKFLQSQDEALRVLENAKQEHKCSVVSEGEMQKISMQILQEKSDKEKLQVEVARLKESVKRENETLKIENERLVGEMKEMRNNRKEIEDSLSKLKAELSSGLLEQDQN
ncbi:hypothetical protein L7F22_018749 [Adiantum nelumboides]|nr:hypothetical protein [Adiantum nelumboides]